MGFSIIILSWYVLVAKEKSKSQTLETKNNGVIGIDF